MNLSTNSLTNTMADLPSGLLVVLLVRGDGQAPALACGQDRIQGNIYYGWFDNNDFHVDASVAVTGSTGGGQGVDGSHSAAVHGGKGMRPRYQ